jgi:glycosyltransferase involved in cell wall biosynthesis
MHPATMLVRLGVDPKRLVTIPYGVRPHGAAPDPRDESLLVEMVRARHRGALVVACVGTIGPRKNQALLVEAAAILKRRDATPVLIVLAGEGDTTAIQAQIAADGLEGVVRVHGYTPAARRIAAAADLLVLPSQGEGQPLAVLEAFCDDVLVAASDIAELRELVEHGTTGLVFTANDAGALAEALAGAARLPAPARRAMRTRARNRVSATHTVAQMNDAHLAVYRSLPSGPASAPAPGVFSVA